MKKYFFMLFFLMIIIPGCGTPAASIYLKKGKESYKKENNQMAIQFFEKTLAIDSNLMEAKYYKALCYYKLGHTHHACEEMSVLLKNGYDKADSTLQKMGCFYFPEDTTGKDDEKLK